MNSSANTSGAGRIQFPQMTLAFKRLCWKETLQLAPLVIMLLVLNGLLHLLPVISSVADRREFHLVLLHLIPCLFASGAGALLVSMEKEQRTISWLSSLPIASSQIMRAKLWVALASLAIVWLVCLLITLVADRGLPNDLVFPKDARPSIVFTLSNSVFLLFLGIATAWRYQTPLVALVMIVPLAILATMITLSIQGLSPERRLPDSLLVLFYALFSGAVLWYGWRSGQAYLTSKPRSLVAQNMLNKLERSGSRGNLLTSKPQGLASTLLWQFSVQNRMVLITIGALVLLPALTLAMNAFEGEYEVLVVPAWLVVSWLGASVFQSDSVHQRVKFLAERGVAPPTIWWTRQIIPFGLIAVGTILAVLLLWYVSVAKVNPNDHRTHPVLLLGAPIVLVVHAAAQWLGQIVRSPIVSLILAPAITSGATFYLAFAVFETGAPIWIVLFPIAIAFIATRVMTSPWMDGRTGMKYWLGHGAFLLAALAFPLMPFFLTLCFYPGMPRSAQQRFYAEAKRSNIAYSTIELTLLTRAPLESEVELQSMMGGMGAEDAGLTSSEADSNQDSTVPSEVDAGAALASVTGEQPNAQPELEVPDVGFVEQIKQNVAHIESQLESRTGATSWSQAISFVSAEAMLTRAQLDLDPSNEESKERFQTSVRVLVEVDKRLRLSWRLIDQEFADRLEIWLYQQLKAEGGRALLGEPNEAAISTLLADKAGRMAARRRAIVSSWGRAWSASTAEPNQLGGMSLKITAGLSGWRESIANYRRASRAAWLLLEYLESNDASEADRRFAELAAFWGTRVTRNARGGISPESVFHVPGQNWFAEWEDYRP